MHRRRCATIGLCVPRREYQGSWRDSCSCAVGRAVGSCLCLLRAAVVAHHECVAALNRPRCIAIGRGGASHQTWLGVWVHPPAAMSGLGSLDVLDGMENDPEVERNGMKAAAEHNAAHWQRLLELVASCSTDRPQRYLMQDTAMEDRLYKIYQMNFGGAFGIDLENSTWAELHGSEMLLA